MASSNQKSISFQAGYRREERPDELRDDDDELLLLDDELELEAPLLLRDERLGLYERLELPELLLRERLLGE